MSTRDDDMHVDWLTGQFLPVFHAPQELLVYNVQSLAYDLQLSIATLAGLINRLQARIYLNWREFDLFWLREVLSHIPSTISPLTGEGILREMLHIYRERVAGYVIYNPTCLESVNVATMLAAQCDGFVVSPALADRLREKGEHFPVIDDMRAYPWRSRAQVYHWAWQHLFAGATPRLIAGLAPETAVGIRPYLVATKAFIYWLHPLAITPKNLQSWPPERQVMKSILRTCLPGTMHLEWFLQEGSGVTLTSQHAIPVVASDYLSNLETWSGVTSPSVTSPPPHAPTQLEMQPRVYVAFTMSEGDNLQYIQEQMPRHWRHPQRGSIPIGWPMALILQQAAPAMWDYYVRTASANDEFMAAPSGLAYSYPSKWARNHLAAYLTQTGQAMQQMGLSLIEVLDSNFWSHPLLIYRAMKSGAGMTLVHKQHQKDLARGLRPFGLHGILSGGGQARTSYRYSEDIPILQNVGIASSVSQAVALIRQATPRQRPAFLNVYVLAWQMGPGELQTVAHERGDAYEIVTPGTLVQMGKALRNCHQ